MPPCCWPSTSSGLITVPQSSTATWRTTRDPPVSRSTSTTAMWAPNGNVASPWSKWPRRRGRRAAVASRTRAAPPARGRARPTSSARGRDAGDADRAGVGVDDDVGDVGLEQVGGELAWPCRPAPRSPGARPSRRAAASASRRCRRRVGTRSVSPSTSADAVDRDAGLVADEHGERRLVALAVGERAGPHGGRAVVVDLDGAELAGAAAGRDLDVGGDADAERDAGRRVRRRSACSRRSSA